MKDNDSFSLKPLRATFLNYGTGRMLLLDDFTYVQSSKTMWYCTKRRTHDCKAKVKLTSDGEYIDEVTDNHNHGKIHYIVTGGFLVHDQERFLGDNFCRKTRNRSYLWNYYDEVGPNSAGCRLCSKLLSKNLSRHLKNQHPKAFSQAKEFLRKSLNGRKRSYLWNYYDEVGPKLASCRLCSKLMSKNMSRHLKTRHPEAFSEVKDFLDKSINQRPRKNSTSWVKGSWVKKYCAQIKDTNKYRCNMCHAVLSLVHGFLGNMKRHIRTKHPLIYEKEVSFGTSDTDRSEIESVEDNPEEMIEYLDESIEQDGEEKDDDASEAGSDVEEGTCISFLNEDNPDFEDQVRSLCLKKVDKKRAKSLFWNFFSVVEEDHRYTCLTCKRRVIIFPKSVANLKRHIQTRHKKQFKLIMQFGEELNSEGGKESPISFDKYYFDIEGEGEYKCKECGDVISSVDEDQQVLFDHIKDNHPDQILAYQEDPIDNDDSELSEVVIVKAVEE